MPNTILNDTLTTITGGILLTVILFFLNEFVFVTRNLSGEWTTTILINNTCHAPYNNLSIEYKIHLIQKGYDISGSGEKVKDIYPNGAQTVFDFDKRTTVKISGYYSKKYFQKSILFLSVIEQGRKRESRSTYSLKISRRKGLTGTFISTVANSRGIANLTKNDFCN